MPERGTSAVRVFGGPPRRAVVEGRVETQGRAFGVGGDPQGVLATWLFGAGALVAVRYRRAALRV